MNSVDYKVLEILSKQGRISWKELSEMVGLSVSSTADRVKKMEREKVILGYKAIVDEEKIGKTIQAFIQVEYDKALHDSAFFQEVMENPLITECYNVAGEGGYLLKVECFSIKELDFLVSDGLKLIPGVTKTVTKVILSKVK